jgi:hypothetical protein
MKNPSQYDPLDEDFDIPGPERRGRIRFRWILILFAALLLFIFWPAFASFYSDWLWFRELGYEMVFSTLLLTKLVLGTIAGLAAAALIWLNFKLAARLSNAYTGAVRYFTLNDQRVPMPDLASAAVRWLLPVSLIAGVLIGMRVWGLWEVILKYRYRTSFGEADPIFGRDIGFYFFTLPLLESVSELLLLLLVAALVLTGALYALRGGVRFLGDGLMVERAPRRHLLCLLSGVFLILGWRAWLEMPNLLYSTDGPVAGASYTDITARLPMLKAEMFVALIIALMAAATMFIYSLRPLLLGLGVYVLVLVIGGWLYPAVVQRFSVAPNELVKETPYIIHNIAATRKAFGLDRVEERELSGSAGLTLQDIEENKSTISNIRLWDHPQLLNTFAQLQEIRPYYEFQSVDNDRYRIGNEVRQVMISPRELAAESLPNRNWINERLTFTHGFGLTLGPVNQVTPQGLPVLFIKDIPPASSVPALNVTNPEIYFGEMPHDPVYVKTATKEFNYPAGEENVYANYGGDGGVSIGSYWRRLLFSTRFGDMKLLLSNEITPESRVLFHRNIRDRLRRVAPYLSFDHDPYLVISEGRLFWIADAYTVSNRYPYSEPISGINYIRNSVKAVVDVYHGTVRLYIADPSDPLILTWSKIFPGTLKPLDEMPADLRAHLRYPEYIFSVQTAVYSTYHMDQPQVFYNKEDQWETASVVGADSKLQAMEPYYTIMRLPGEKQEEFILMLPFTPRSKDNLASWMVARADRENYGRLLVYRFPKQKLVYGPKQIVTLINQDAEISRQISLWDQRGSKVIQGTLLVIPIKESLIYVRPLYLLAESGGQIPELKRVIVAAENRIAMEETLEASLARIFGSAPAPVQARPEEPLASGAQPPATTPGAPPPAQTQGLALQAKQHYDRAIQAQREGDWARYGEEIKRLGSVIEQMARQK